MESIRLRVRDISDRIRFSETTILIATAIAIGAGTGLGAILFIRLIEFVQGVFFAGSEALFGGMGRWLLIFIPAAGGLIAGPIIAFFASEAKGHGVPEVMQAIALRGGRIRPRVVVAKIAASAICIGSGGSAGREGPIVQVGAALGSTLGQWLKLSSNRIRNLVACGAAAGIAATFNAPIAGVIFAMEVILGELHLGDLGNVIISAVTASTLARVFLGDYPAFAIPRYAMQTPWEVFLYALLGVLAAFAAVGFIRLLYWFEDLFDNWKFPDALKPAVGGLLLGILGFVYPMVLGWGGLSTTEAASGLPITANIPHVFGSGFAVIGAALLGKAPFLLLLALIFLKPLATSFTLGSGNSGGVFAPSLFAGAALGGAFGLLVDRVFPGITAGPGAFATVGMAAVFAGAARAPFTAILIVFEMTNDYRLMVPLMAAVIFSMIVAEHIHKESIYTLKLTRRGIHLRRGRDVDVMENITVSEVMRPAPEPIPGNMPLRMVPSLLDKVRMHGLPVSKEDGGLCGVITVQDVEAAVDTDEKNLDLPVTQFCSQRLIVAYPDETLHHALERMSHRDIGRLPVVDRNSPSKLVGWISRADIVRAYERALTRRVTVQQQVTQARLGVTAGVEVVECVVEAGSLVAGRNLSEIVWPQDSLVASIQRGGRLIIPHGETQLQVGDQLAVVARREDEDAIRALARRS
ncbi:MAG: chloride channel protein [Anaerolineales bacterium]|nr:chloride channel protein [Anaerolineales bacterium]